MSTRRRWPGRVGRPRPHHVSLYNASTASRNRGGDRNVPPSRTPACRRPGSRSRCGRSARSRRASSAIRGAGHRAGSCGSIAWYIGARMRLPVFAAAADRLRDHRPAIDGIVRRCRDRPSIRWSSCRSRAFGERRARGERRQSGSTRRIAACRRANSSSPANGRLMCMLCRLAQPCVRQSKMRS